MCKERVETLKLLIVASLLNKWGFTTRFEVLFRQFQQHLFDRAELERRILAALPQGYNGNILNPLVDELVIRCNVIDRVENNLSAHQSEFVKVPPLAWRIDANNRIDPPKSVECYYEGLLQSQIARIDLEVCIKYGLLKFLRLNLPKMLASLGSEELVNNELIASFVLAVARQQLEIAELLWKSADAETKVKMLSNKAYRAVLLAKSSGNLKLDQFITECVVAANLQDTIPSFQDCDLFFGAAVTGNISMLEEIFSRVKLEGDQLKLLTDNNCDAFTEAVGQEQIATQEFLITKLVCVQKTLGVPAEIWIMYFGSLSQFGEVNILNQIWQAIDDIELREQLIKCSIYGAFLHNNVGMAKLLLESAAMFPSNPIEIEDIKKYCSTALSEGVLQMARLLYQNINNATDKMEVLSNRDFTIMTQLIEKPEYEATLIFMVVSALELGMRDQLPMVVLKHALLIANKLSNENLTRGICATEDSIRRAELIDHCIKNDISVDCPAALQLGPM